MNKMQHKTINFTPTELHWIKKPQRIWEKYLFIPPGIETIKTKKEYRLHVNKLAFKRAAKKNAHV